MYRIVVGGAVLLFVAGCSAFKDDMQTLKINCNPPGAVLRVNGERHLCPAQVSVRRDKWVKIEAAMDGYEPETRYIGNHMSAAAKWDAVGTVVWFFPFFGQFFAGARDLDQTELALNMYPVNSAKSSTAVKTVQGEGPIPSPP